MNDVRPRPGAIVVKMQGAKLPHWTADGAIYAVTFRLADSVPREVAEQWRAEREHIVARAAAMERGLTAQEQSRLAVLHSERIESYLNAGHGACHLRDSRIAGLVRDALRHFEGQRYELIAWCIMPNHVHTVFRPVAGHTLAAILHSWKGYTSSMANRLLGRRGALWQSESYDHLVRDEDDLRHAVGYVLRNPIEAGLKDWPWTWAQPRWQERLGAVARAFLPASDTKEHPARTERR